MTNFDVIVVGGGHAGCEAAYSSARLGSKTLLITMDMSKFAQMSCNPAMGGIAKGQIIREIDALGGLSGIISDENTIQFRLLNRSKGPAMWSPRAQIDRNKFSQCWRDHLENTPNLFLWQDTVVKIKIENGFVRGVVTTIGVDFKARCVVLTNGTFLNGLLHIGKSQFSGGRIGEMASFGLSDQLKELNFNTGRLKTGTPVRIDGRSVDFAKLTEQIGEEEHHRFSFLTDGTRKLYQRSCWITYTSAEVHKELTKGFADSPMYNGTIKSTGPRYCPSIESKLVTFSEKERHQLFLEPEGETTNEYYLNGFSSSLPWDVQYEALRKIPGFEEVIIFRPGYAIEYDYFDPVQLRHTLETKLITNLFFAGQINGTTGYEEAAAQGLMAGINAHFKAQGFSECFVLGRDEAYIGVLIDDLVTKGVDEPYRMFTSRAEYRILLRQDNADERLTPKGYQLGLAGYERVEKLNRKLLFRDKIIQFLREKSIKPDQVNDLLKSKGSTELKQGCKIVDILTRPQIGIRDLVSHFLPLEKFFRETNAVEREELFDSIEIKVKYEGYIQREKMLAEKLKRLENIEIGNKLEFEKILTLSTEARQKLSAIRPATLGQASRIPGISPADINVLMVLLGR